MVNQMSGLFYQMHPAVIQKANELRAEVVLETLSNLGFLHLSRIDAAFAEILKPSISNKALNPEWEDLKG